jgi:hypothetical protein
VARNYRSGTYAASLPTEINNAQNWIISAGNSNNGNSRSRIFKYIWQERQVGPPLKFHIGGSTSPVEYYYRVNQWEDHILYLMNADGSFLFFQYDDKNSLGAPNASWEESNYNRFATRKYDLFQTNDGRWVNPALAHSSELPIYIKTGHYEPPPDPNNPPTYTIVRFKPAHGDFSNSTNAHLSKLQTSERISPYAVYYSADVLKNDGDELRAGSNEDVPLGIVAAVHFPMSGPRAGWQPKLPAAPLKYVLVHADGSADYYNPDGRMVNAKNDIISDQDDYLTYNWNADGTLQSLAAPPSDGRALNFSYNQGLLENVSLQAGTQTYNNLIRYEYVSSGAAAGKLYRVKYQNYPNSWGIQYDYGRIVFQASDQATISSDTNNQPPQLCMISEFNETTVRPLVATEYDYSSAATPVTAQWLKDPATSNPAGGNWRKAFDCGAEFADGNFHTTLTFGSGALPNGTGRYNNIDTKILVNKDAAGNVVSMSYDGAHISPHETARNNFYPNTQTIQSQEVLIDSSWVTQKLFDYANPGTANERLNSLTEYAEYESDGADGHQPNLNTALVTSYAYADSNWPNSPTSITYPDGRRIAVTYNSSDGSVHPVVEQRRQGPSSTYVDFSTSTYAYVATGVNAGKVQSLTTTYPDATYQHTVTYGYYGLTEWSYGAILGQIMSVSDY